MELALNIPQNYVEIDEQEMMYLDGGYTLYTNWWGHSLKITKSECGKLSAGASMAGVLGTSNPMILFMATLASAVFGIGANGRGLWVNRTWTASVWVSF